VKKIGQNFEMFRYMWRKYQKKPKIHTRSRLHPSQRAPRSNRDDSQLRGAIARRRMVPLRWSGCQSTQNLSN